MTKPTKLCPQRRLRSVWASAQSDQSSLCTQWVAKDPSFLHADSEDSDQTGRMPWLIWVFTGCTWHFVGYFMLRLNYKSWNYGKSSGFTQWTFVLVFGKHFVTFSCNSCSLIYSVCFFPVFFSPKYSSKSSSDFSVWNGIHCKPLFCDCCSVFSLLSRIMDVLQLNGMAHSSLKRKERSETAFRVLVFTSAGYKHREISLVTRKPETGLLSYKSWNFGLSKYRYYTI